MKSRPSLPKAELEIAQVVWKLQRARVRDVAAALPQERELDFFTVQTYLRRLKTKGYLRTEREGRADVYVPAVQPSGVIRDAVIDFVDRLFGGEPIPLVQHLINDAGLSDEEIDKLQATLNELKLKR